MATAISLPIARLRNTDGQVERIAGESPSPIRKNDCIAPVGLSNGRAFQQRLQQALALARTSGNALALLIIDIDHFRQLASALGPRRSEDALLAIDARLRGCVTSADTVMHVEKDIFGILLNLPESANVSIHRVCGKLLGTLNQPLRVGGHEIYMSGCVACVISPQHGEDALTLVMRAEVAMHQAKRTGGNAYRIFTEATALAE